MKRILPILSALLLFTFIIEAQTVPRGMKFQAVARNNQGEVLAGELIRLQVSLRGDGPEGTLIFRELHQAETNELGLFSLIIGEGKSQAATLDVVPWHTGNIWMEIGLEETGKKDFQIIHSARLLSVPYALHAASAERILTSNEKSDSIPCSVGGEPHWPKSGHPKVDEGNFIGTTNQQALVFKTDSLERMRISGDSDSVFIKGTLWVPELHLKADSLFSGGKQDHNFNDYPVRIKNAKQGMAIKLDGAPDAGQNFLTFWDSTRVLGRIEGQTTEELISSEEYWRLIGFGEINRILTQAEGGAADIQGDQAEAVVNYTLAVVLEAQWMGWAINKGINVGVSYASGGADYAEWLECKTAKEELKVGEVVGIKGGKVSRNTEDVELVRVISGNPVVLGNQPPENVTNRYGKIALLGQVPVWVYGKVKPGDFIIPSGQNDGIGIAVTPEEIHLDQFNKVLGIAWSASEGRQPINLVKVAIGGPSEGLVGKIQEEQEEMVKTKLAIERLKRYLEDHEPGFAAYAPPSPSRIKEKNIADPDPNDQALEDWAANNKFLINKHLDHLKNFLEEMEIDLETYPELKDLLDNPESLFQESWSTDEFQKNILERMEQRKKKIREKPGHRE